MRHINKYGWKRLSWGSLQFWLPLQYVRTYCDIAGTVSKIPYTTLRIYYLAREGMFCTRGLQAAGQLTLRTLFVSIVY